MMNAEEFYEALIAQNEFVIKYDLEAMRAAVTALGLQCPARQVVLVGGTNGKGTTCCVLNALATAAGKKVGLYTSPHLVDFRERIRVDSLPIPLDTMIRIGVPILERFGGAVGDPLCGRPLSYFELTTLLALSYFKEADLDIAIIEVGLGGRLDATNTVDPNLSIFTSISLDHQEYLGDTIEAIAAEKAPIARRDRPSIIHEQAGGAEALRSELLKLGAELHTVAGSTDSPLEFNSALACRAAELLELSVQPDHAKEVLSRIVWPGRRDVRSYRGVDWFIDGAHNEEATRACAAWLGTQAPQGCCAIIGASPGRDIRKVFAPYRGLIQHAYVVPASTFRTVDPVELSACLDELGVESTILPTVSAAINAVLESGCKEAAVLGSLYLCGAWFSAAGYTAEDIRFVRSA